MDETRLIWSSPEGRVSERDVRRGRGSYYEVGPYGSLPSLSCPHTTMWLSSKVRLYTQWPKEYFGI